MGVLWLTAGVEAAEGITNLRVSQRAGTDLVDIRYDLATESGSGLFVAVAVSTNGGLSYDLPAIHFTGDVGAGVMAGADRHIVWDAGKDWPGQYSANVFFRLTATDTPLSIVCPGAVSVSAAGPGGATVTYPAPTVSDLVDPNPVVACVPASGSVFPLGTTTVICTATDASGNSASCSFTVTVVDATPPSIVCPGAVSVSATGPAGATVNYPAPTVSDLVDPNPVVACVPASGSAFPLGTTTVICTATDASGNSASCSFTVTVVEATAPPPRMVLIPAGGFLMGDAFSEGFGSELPLHEVYVSGFYMDRYEVTMALWDEVYTWALVNGYAFDNAGSGKAPNHPVHGVAWYDVVKWCNARSEKEGHVPAYYTDGAHATVYRAGEVDIQNGWVKWNAGYRLPTEAEWEKAARGGAQGRRFPWSDMDTIAHSRANYYSSDSYAYDISPTRGYHPDFQAGGQPFTSPVGSFEANGYGLYDMAGNVWEWCWDWYSGTYYGSSPRNDPRGPASGAFWFRVVRGGSWSPFASSCGVAERRDFSPGWGIDFGGFRSVLPSGTVVDTTPPSIVCPGAVSVPATGPAGATVDYPAPTVTDDTDPNPLVVCVPASGSVFPLGTTTVVCTATDASGNSASCSFTVTVVEVIAPPPSMVMIPAGSFLMGDTFAEGSSSELPLHEVYVSGFYMDQYEVTKGLWDEVRVWANGNGYDLGSVGGGKAANHPVHSVSWYDIVKWCNARSEKEGRVPAYYTDAGHTTVYRTGAVDVQNDWVKWNAGYRLPTEAEWEKAARGSAQGRRFPWSDVDTITHNRANYGSSSSYVYDTSPTRGGHPTFNDGVLPYTSPVGFFAGNGYGLYDMAGNVREWCWDWYSIWYYRASPASDPRGPDSGTYRVVRGGGWRNSAIRCRPADRVNNWPRDRDDVHGFRSVLPPG